MNTNDKVEKAVLLEAQAKKLRKEIYQEHQANLKAKSVAERLVYAAYSCCPCGAGLAYDPCYEDEAGKLGCCSANGTTTRRCK